jgi:hypothetical protein
VCDNLVLSFLSNSSNILSHLAILIVSLTFPFCTECKGGQEAYLVLAGLTSSTKRNIFGPTGAERHSALCVGDGMLRHDALQVGWSSKIVHDVQYPILRMHNRTV